MAGFSFPPPPPPPPKPVQQQQQPEFDYSSQAGRGGRGRGSFEPRGRGGPGRGRGRGNSNHEPLGQRSTSAQSGQGHEAPYQQQGSYHATHNIAQPPPGSYINPNFAGQRYNASASTDHQPGQIYNTSYAGANTSANVRPQKSLANDGPGRSQAGHKRKLDALRGPQQSHEKKPGPQTVPSVPSFGAPILPPIRTPASNQSTGNTPPVQATSRPQSISRTLGLTPKDGTEPDYSSESADDGDEDDVDEEAQFVELGTKLTFEHNGEVMTLNNEADLAAWKEERRKQFPTTQRVSQKENELLQVGEERKRLLAAVSRLHQAPRNRHAEAKKKALRERESERESLKTQDEASRSAGTAEQKQTDSSGSGIQEVDMLPAEPEAIGNLPAAQQESLKQQPTSVDKDHNMTAAYEPLPTDQGQGQEVPKTLPGIDMGETDDESDAAAGAAKEPQQKSEDESASESESEDDGPPEQVSSKPPRSAVPDAQRPVCKYFAASGRCRDGDFCRFRHELSNRAPSARPAQPQPDKPAYDRFAPKLDPKSNDHKSIFERLVEQEEQGDDRLALQVIKALGQAGLFKQAETC